MKLLLYQMRFCVAIMVMSRFIHHSIIEIAELFAWPFGELHGKTWQWKERIVVKATKVANRGRKKNNYKLNETHK